MKKKYIALFVILITCGEYVFAQHHTLGRYDLTNTFALLYFNKGKVFDLSPLSVPAEVAFIMNLFVGYGTGSFAQGDRLGGTVAVAGEIGGMGLIVGGVLFAVSDKVTEQQAATGLAVAIGGAILFFGTKVFELIRPWFFG